MSKELEALERMCSATLEEDLSVRDIYENEYDILEQALKRLEAIDNAEPSEALECLQSIEADLTGLPKHVTEYDDGFDSYLEDIWNNLDIIKQALLKTQEPKHYLKWEDLEFKEESQWLKVKMGDNLYRIDWLIDGLGANVVSIYKYITNDYLVYCACIKDNSQQFFNDLRLERVEE